jgi:hypothetical protein
MIFFYGEPRHEACLFRVVAIFFVVYLAGWKIMFTFALNCDSMLCSQMHEIITKD